MGLYQQEKVKNTNENLMINQIEMYTLEMHFTAI